ncbi:MAG: DUF3276 family protein [Chitinophagaceae bacterium]
MEKRSESVFSTRIRAGKKRTYFFDVRTTKSNDYFVTITESRRKLGEDGFEKNKIFLYKEDFNKFVKSLQETVNHVKQELLPDFDFDTFNHDENVEAYNQHSEKVPTFSTQGESTINPEINNASLPIEGEGEKW